MVGPQGERGEPGPQGERGERGEPGESPSISAIVSAVIDSLNRLPEDERPLEGVTPVPFTFTGEGEQITGTFVLAKEVLYVLKAEFDDDWSLYAWLYAMNGDREESLSFAHSPGSGVFSVSDTGEFLFEVTPIAGGPWTLTVDVP